MSGQKKICFYGQKKMCIRKKKSVQVITALPVLTYNSWKEKYFECRGLR